MLQSGSAWQLRDEIGELAFEDIPVCLPNRDWAQAIVSEWPHDQKVSALAVKKDRPATQVAKLALLGTLRTPQIYQQQLLSYLVTDTLLFWHQSPLGLFHAQESQWRPVLDWTATTFGAVPAPRYDFDAADVPETLKTAVADWLAQCDGFALAGLVFLTGISGSLLLGLAQTMGRLEAEAAYSATYLEALYQRERWGHDAEGDARLERGRQGFVLAEFFLHNNVQTTLRRP
ncbi:MAG: hypothetical protein HRT36_00210 [Alphaproteobacteria bacterium]|nr:hypothetical protein [Alphaproteobacteria bacterium]